LQRFRKFHEHEVLFQFAILHESPCLLCSRINRIGMLGVLKSLPFNFLGYAIEKPVGVLNRHISILPCMGAFARGPETAPAVKSHSAFDTSTPSGPTLIFITSKSDLIILLKLFLFAQCVNAKLREAPDTESDEQGRSATMLRKPRSERQVAGETCGNRGNASGRDIRPDAGTNEGNTRRNPPARLFA
jgi:hypothetical protein